ncbi:hypothetical protein A1O1_03796 [Capronia coronata CBS 617.96]|uniref:SEC7 domain-containing protein n=1 Tax=Capronia coronata CBS 617.96 TaxID=1182541 RepID=W9YCT3_9EURO|nr:uncharacterized protein A1O1_03796 [Capronia coronata CBS 617.96]EXJ90692.1 hypothetical protein A1O1_03796 [Capronia coronata CBS 617.96]
MSGVEGESPETQSSPHPELHSRNASAEDIREEGQQDHSEELSVPADPTSHGVTITIEDADADAAREGTPTDEDAADAADAASQDGTSVVTESQVDSRQPPMPQGDAEDTSLNTAPPQGSEEASQNGAGVEGDLPHQQQDEGITASTSHEGAPPTRPARSDSRSTTMSRPSPVNSTVFVVNALETIAAAKEVRKNKEFADAVQAALSNVKSSEQAVNPEIIFRPLQMATRSFHVPLQVTALDCIGKLISYSYFAFPVVATNQPAVADTPPLIERAIEAICDCFENEATPVEVQQQIIKSLLAAVLDDKIVVHGAGLLKAVRQIYNIFIYSKSSQNQQVAQGSLLQMVATVFERVRVRLDMKEARLREHTGAKSDDALSGEASMLEHGELNGLNEQAETPDQETPPQLSEGSPKTQEKLTLQSFENNKHLDDAVVADSAPTTVTRARRERKNTRSSSGPVSRHEDHEDSELSPEDEDDIYIKDAFLVFRSLCKLSQKVLNHDQQDLRGQNMRSKLLSLHLIYHVLNNYTTVFTSSFSIIKSSNNDEGTPFLQVAKPHLCLSLSRNAASAVSRVYEVCCEIFWLCLKNLRVLLKKELEVFLKEIYLAVLERRSAPPFQKQMFLDVLERLAGDPRALVEVYLNYDCDRTALDNMYQEIIEHLSRICSTPVVVTPQQQHQYQEQQAKQATQTADWHSRGSLLPALSTTSLSHPSPPPSPVPIEYTLKQQALRCLVETLSSLDNWSSHPVPDHNDGSRYPTSRASFEDSRESLDDSERPPPSPRVHGGSESGFSTPVAEDDPNEIEKVRKRKSALNEAIRQFNFKPKRGIKTLIAEGFIRSNAPQDIAKFLYGNERLDKTTLGEYLGEGDEHNIAVMHAFVDMMDFRKRRFVDALRQFLQSFRLPGEAQKIDRFMLKFAERYLSGNPNAFANADTAYVLAYSAVMLNTDQHSTKMKGRRMTVDDFIKNNRGINDGHDLPAEYLASIYEDIASNEIVLASEREHAAELGIIPATPSAGLASRAGQVFANVGRDLQKEKYAQASEEMANKTEQLYRSLIRAQKRSAVREALSRFIPATSVKHVGPMFNVTWMSFLSAFSSQMQDAQNLELIKQCLEGFRLAIRIACRFDLETPRVAFVTALAKFTNLSNLKEMMAKNLEALKVLIEVALTEGDGLKSSWREVLMCISQLDRLQLLSTGIDEEAIPDVTRASIPTPSNLKDTRRSRRSMQAVKRPRPRSSHSFRPEVADETKSTDMIRGVDRIFTNSSKLSSEAIIDFVRALSEVSWQEIQSSGNSDSPRTYSLQKLVEISYYNMTRVRIEWTRIWEVLGEHFNQVGCHNNTAVVFFALDSLRQLSMRFMEIEELPGFKFQKDFLKPFEHVMANSNAVSVKDMILRCLIQMIQARGDNIRSGWKTMFGVFSVAAREQYESIVNIAFDYTTQIYNTRFGVVISQGSFPDMIVCLTEFSKNLKFQKKSLQAIELLKSTVPKMLKTPECPLSRRHIKGVQAGDSDIVAGVKQPTSQTEEEQFWYPVLIAYQDVLMTGEDLEVRSRALTYLFETLIRYGGDFPIDFWDVLWRQLLYPIFVVLQSKSEMSKAPNHEELSVWLSTTMIQALRNMITLFTHYFESLEHMLDRFLDLLTLCICQENDTIARIGSNCLQQLILQNVTKFTPEHWSRIVMAFVELFNRTTAYELFSAAATMSDARPTPTHDGSDGLSISGTTIVNTATTNGGASEGHALASPPESRADPMAAAPEILPAQTTPELEDYRPHSDMQVTAPVVTAARRRFFNKIITNCVLQLLMIETVAELFSNDSVYAQIPSSELLRLMALLKKSYQFAKKFNGDKDLRMALWRQGFMRQPPNLLKQESGSANTYVSILLRMYHDEGEERRASREQTEGALIPLCADIIRSFVLLDEETQQRNIIAWRPVVIDVLEGLTNFPKDSFEKHVDIFYPLAVGLLEKEVNADLRSALWGMFRRVGEVKFNMPELIMARGRDDSVSSTTRNGSIGGATPTSPGTSQSGRGFEYAASSRRGSRVSRTGAV